jgi:hypothetical protein
VSPVPLFPDISLDYQLRLLDPRKKESGYESEWAQHLEQDASVSRVYGVHSRLTPHRPMLQELGANMPTFHELAEVVFGPLLTNLQRPDYRTLLSQVKESYAGL